MKTQITKLEDNKIIWLEDVCDCINDPDVLVKYLKRIGADFEADIFKNIFADPADVIQADILYYSEHQ